MSPGSEDPRRDDTTLENSSLNSSLERLSPGRCSVMNSIDPPRPESVSESSLAFFISEYESGRNCRFAGSGGAGGTAGGLGMPRNSGSTSTERITWRAIADLQSEFGKLDVVFIMELKSHALATRSRFIYHPEPI